MQSAIKKIALITGATSGIGYATTRLFAKKGFNLIITGRRADRLKDIKHRLEDKYGIKIMTLCFDIRDKTAVFQAWDSLTEEWKNVDVLVNNAGLAKGVEPVDQGNTEYWETMIDTNIKGLLYITRLVSPVMVNNKSGHIVNVCSTAGHDVYPNGNVYVATKFAVKALTRTIRLDLYKHNIRVGEVSPGHVEETEFALVRYDGDSEKAKNYKDFTPLKAGDVADAIYYLVSRPAHVNIQEIILMGTQQAGSNFINRSGRLDSDS